MMEMNDDILDRLKPVDFFYRLFYLCRVALHITFSGLAKLPNTKVKLKNKR